MSKEYDEYAAHAHAVQTAIAFNPDKRAQEPKHLRVGIDMTKADMKGLATLLMAKGVFTLAEYQAYLTQSAKEEAELQKRSTAEAMGIHPDRLKTI